MATTTGANDALRSHLLSHPGHMFTHAELADATGLTRDQVSMSKGSLLKSTNGSLFKAERGKLGYKGARPVTAKRAAKKAAKPTTKRSAAVTSKSNGRGRSRPVERAMTQEIQFLTSLEDDRMLLKGRDGRLWLAEPVDI